MASIRAPLKALVARLVSVMAWAPVAALAAAGACAPRQAAEEAVLGRGVRRVADVAYGSGAGRTLDVYARPVRIGSAPVVVFLYGGRWKYGEKRDYLLMGNTLARRGWVVVIPEYRKYPEALFPAWVEDGALAVRWARENAARFGGDTRRLFVIGHSAGAHTATLLALDEHYLREAGVPPDAVRGFISIAGPVDTTWTARDVQRLMGPREGWPASYPSTHVDGSEPPLLLLHGDADDVVTVGNSTRLADRIRARRGCARAIVYPGVGHVDIAVALGLPRLLSTRLDRVVASFVRDPVGVTCPGAR
jgi:acetyl esterase/lipase